MQTGESQVRGTIRSSCIWVARKSSKGEAYSPSTSERCPVSSLQYFQVPRGWPNSAAPAGRRTSPAKALAACRKRAQRRSAKARDQSASRVQLQFIQPGKPVQNAFAESFIGRLRDECLSDHWFGSLWEARRLIEEWRRHYNEQRPHCSLGYQTPMAHARQFAAAA